MSRLAEIRNRYSASDGWFYHDIAWLLSEVERRSQRWPALAYIFGTWEYALNRARDLATEKQQRTYLYRGSMNGRPCWVVSWDPKPEAASV